MYSFQDCSQLHDSDTADEDSNTSSHDIESDDSDFNESNTEMMIMRKKANWKVHVGILSIFLWMHSNTECHLLKYFMGRNS